jgi:hypothetical protein
MSNEKTTISKAGPTPLTQAIRGYGGVAGEKPPAPEVVKLEIDENDDFGSDPYNRTGSHCILELGEDA